MPRHTARALSPLAPLFLAAAAAAQPCTPEFSDRFPTGDLSGNVNALLTFSDARGLALYAGGAFLNAGGTAVNRIARWQGSGWEPMDAGFNGAVNAMAVFDDGNGPALYAAGAFTSAGTTAVSRIARWTGTSWAPLAAGVNNSVKALAVFDEDGAGPAPARLFAAGDFTLLGPSGSPAASRLARWDGTAWSAVSTGCDGSVETLHVHDDGAGPALYLGGAFTTAGGVTVNRIAKYDGVQFSALGSGTTSNVTTLGSHDPDGPGGNPAQLIVGGNFTTIGGISANRIARWTGGAWQDMGAGLNAAVARVRVYNDGHGERLFVIGGFTTAGGLPAERIAKWDGAAWSAVSPAGLSGTASDMVPFNDGRGDRLFVAGTFGTAGGVAAVRIATWDGTNWSGIDRSFEAGVDTIAFHQGEVYIAGSFARADGEPAGRIVRFDGEEFFPLGGGLSSGSVDSMVSHDDGSGPALFIGGNFTTVDGQTMNRIARWAGGVYSPLMVGVHNGVNGAVNDMVIWNDGSGAALYAAGSFTTAGGTAATRIAKWDGAAWSPLGTGFNNTVNGLAVYNDGTGEALYAVGSFTTAGGAPANRIARWDGAAWSEVGGGLNAAANDLAVYSGELYVGGTFSIAGVTSVNRIARWNGTAWLDVASGVNNTVSTLAVHDEDGPGGSDPALFVAGLFATAGGNPATRVARWNGSAWSAVGTAGEGADATVNTLASAPTGAAAGLYLGGAFTSAGGVSSGRIARWGCTQAACYANCDGSVTAPILNVADFTCFLQRFAAGESYANCDNSTAMPTLNVADFTCFLQRFAAGCQ